jgi:uncharacterized protein YndB with AHSA1/START domain
VTAALLADPPAPAAGMGPDWQYLAAHGLDAAADCLRFPAGAPWHTLRRCAHPGCERPAEVKPWLCHRCRAAWAAAGRPADVTAWAATTAAPPERRIYGDKPCTVGCARPAEASGLCKSCAGAARTRGLSAAAYLATRPAPRPGFGTCRVAVCQRMAELRRTRLCKSHRRQWSNVGRPDLATWAAHADPIYTAIDEVPLSGLRPLVRLQVLCGYQAQLRAGGRLSPSQVKSAVVWLRLHQTADLLTAGLPGKGPATTYLRVWRQALRSAADDPAAARRSTAIRLATLSPRLHGTVHLDDIHAPWLVHLAQEQVWALAASGASAANIANAGHAVRWFAFFLRTQHPGQGRAARDVGRPVVVEAEVDINRPPEEVFDYCSDHRHEPQWNPMMTRIEKLTDGPIGAGTRYAAEFVKGPPMVMECTRYERPTTWSLTGQSRALTAAGGWRVLPTADGARLAMRVEMELHGPLKLAAPLVRRREQPMFQRDLDNIKARLEAAHAAPGTGPGQQEE